MGRDDSMIVARQILCRLLITCLSILATSLLLIGQTSAQETDSPRQSDFATRLSPLLQSYCYGCHGQESPEGEIDLSQFSSWTDLQSDPLLIETMIEALEKNEMPPAGEKQPSQDERTWLVGELKQALQRSISHLAAGTPFRLRRMNRFEYGNAVRDLFALESWVYSINDRIIRDHNGYFRPETGQMPDRVVVGNRLMGLQQLLENRLLGVMAFPKDAPAENGYNNRGDHLSLTPVLMQSFMELSRSVVNAENFDQNCGNWESLFEDPANPRPPAPVVRITDESGMARGSGVTISAWIRPARTTDPWQTIVRREDSWRRQLLAIGKTGETWGLWMGAGIDGQYVEFGAPVDREILGDGEWHHVAGTYDGQQIKLYLDGQPIGSQTAVGQLHTQSRRPMQVGSYDSREPFHGDLKQIQLYSAGLEEVDIGRIARGKREADVDHLVGSWDPASVAPPLVDPPLRAIAHQRIEQFLLQAFRAPADPPTLQLYTGFFDKRFQENGDFTQSMKDVVSAALASPRFMLVHNETRDDLPHSAAYQLATRLSFFLWSSIPDRRLLELADSGQLLEEQALGREVERMLNDPRVKNFCDSFAPQWLKLNNLVSASPNFEQYREYYFGGDDKISYKRGMHMMLEPLLNFETVFVENRPILELVDADFTYRSHLLSEWYEGRAATYPINVNLRDIEFTRTPLEDRRYGGVITTSAVMVMTSNPQRSLPITRGSWVASVIFNDPPEPPPENVPDLQADDQTLEKEGATIREKLRQHRANPQCASCHQKIDPLGFVLENYDLLGRWRDHYRTGREVDASGKLFGQHSFRDVVEFKDAIRAEQETFATAFVEHLLSYALGRELTLADRMAAVEIAKATKKDDYRMRDVLKKIVLHPVFRQGVTFPPAKTTDE
ncbi:MAG: DUF1592 domain-containing protein [Mariniblastus sp.]|nr:DUF1592 domain-containing protein [Mariniblastus sp.]